MSYGLAKVFLYIALVVFAGVASAGTALDGFQLLKKERGAKISQSIVEIHGERGVPQPEKWIFLLNDPKSRSGIREIVISDGKITSERTPLSGYSGVGSIPTLDMGNLKFDSDAAFRVANDEAASRGIGFHWLDYKLSKGNQGAVWKIHLTDYMGNSVGNLAVSAENGVILRRLELDPNASSTSKQASSRTDKNWAGKGGLVGHASTAAADIANSTKKTFEKTVRSTEKTAVKVQNKILRAAGSVQEWLTGKRTIRSDED